MYRFIIAAFIICARAASAREVVIAAKNVGGVPYGKKSYDIAPHAVSSRSGRPAM